MIDYIDILDENGNKIGAVKERDRAHENGDWHRTVHVWIFNNKGELLIQQRSLRKKKNPGMLGCSMSGHILAGETSVGGAIRKLKEELGIDVAEKDLKMICTVKHDRNQFNREFVDVYVARLNLPISTYVLDKEEVERVEYIPYEKFQEMVRDPMQNIWRHAELHEKLFRYFDSVLNKQRCGPDGQPLSLKR